MFSESPQHFGPRIAHAVSWISDSNRSLTLYRPPSQQGSLRDITSAVIKVVKKHNSELDENKTSALLYCFNRLICLELRDGSEFLPFIFNGDPCICFKWHSLCVRKWCEMHDICARAFSKLRKSSIIPRCVWLFASKEKRKYQN